MKWRLVFLLFFLFPIVTALDYNVGKIDDCVNDLNVKVSGLLQINNNEYILKDCSIIQDNEWKCSCSKSIILSVATNTINNYTFTINYLIQKVTKSSSHSGRYYYNPNITYNDSIFINPVLPINTSSIEYPFYNVTNEYKTVVYNVNPQPVDVIQNNIVPGVEVKKSIWERFWVVLLELLRVKLW